MSIKYTYDRKIHFKDCINQYQGKQNSTILPKVYDDLYSKFEFHNLLIGDKDTIKEIRFKKIKKEHIYIFLQETDNTKHYEDINLIYSNITGVKLPDISHLEESLFEDFDKLIICYDQFIIEDHYQSIIEQNERTNFLNSQYILRQLLKKRNFKINEDDFSSLITIDRINYHDDVCGKMFEILGWTFYPLI
jgi:hypothetical protein